MSKVFISYSHDSPEHADKVLEFANKLRSEGIDAILDQYEESPVEGWPKWMDRQIENSDFILLVCTERYYRKVMGTVDEGLGVKWESTLAYQDLYDAGAESTRFIPVLFKGGSKKHIPKPFAGATRYYVENKKDYENLYRRLTNQPKTKKPRLGKFKSLGVPEAKTNFFVDAGGDSGGAGGGAEELQQEQADTGSGTGEARKESTGGKHQKVVLVKQITDRLKLKRREKKPHICHNDKKNKKECYVQRRTVKLAKEVGNFDRETDGILTFATVMDSIVASAPEVSVKSGWQVISDFKKLILELFRLSGINEAELEKMRVADDESAFLEQFQAKVLSALPANVRKNCDADEIRCSVVWLISFLFDRKILPWQYPGSEYSMEKTLLNIKGYIQPIKNTMFVHLQNDVELAYKDIHTAVGSFSDPPLELERAKNQGGGVFRNFFSRIFPHRAKRPIEIVEYSPKGKTMAYGKEESGKEAGKGKK